MNLCIDQGNTRAKIAIFDSGNLIEVRFFEELTAKDLSELISQKNIQKGILSSVKKEDPEIIKILKGLPFFIEFTPETALPIQNLYATPKTLGKDRLAGVVGAFALNPNNDILVIDAGTAITYDFLSAKGEYLGGTIAPGINMRFAALNQFTGKLPLVSLEGETPLLGKTTEEAIRSGVVNGILFEIEQYEIELRKKYPQLLVFLTGGDCFFLAERLKNPIFANQNLVLIGLNQLIEVNS
jgi:type III pantothenate kinase